jgi:hypothetical protein
VQKAELTTVAFRRLHLGTIADFPRVDGIHDELKNENIQTYLDLGHGFWLVRIREEDIHKTTTLFKQLTV